MDPIEITLVTRAINRDTDAFAELYDRHVVRVYRHVYYIVNHSSDAEDLTAQTFLKAWEAIDHFKQQGAPFVSWLLRIGHNLAISFLRAKRPHLELNDQVEDKKCTPEEKTQQLQEEFCVRKAVMCLRDEQREVVMLRFVEELSYKEVAQAVGKSVPAVRVIQHRALANLRRAMLAATA